MSNHFFVNLFSARPKSAFSNTFNTALIGQPQERYENKYTEYTKNTLGVESQELIFVRGTEGRADRGPIGGADRGADNGASNY